LEAASVTTTRLGLLGGRSPLLRLQSDERLIALLRSGNDAAFEVLFGRYRSRLHAFCRHMLGSKEDAEDILQDVFAAAYNAILADQREINVRPWLYRIARNRCLNHLRRPAPDGRDTMDDQLHANGTTTADLVHKRADLRHLLEDVQKLPETQRTALLLREIDALAYDQIALAMETTIPSVKSLLVRARMSLAEAAEARQLTCDEVREELAEVAEGLKKTSAPVRRHVRECDACSRYRKQLRSTSAAMAMVFPVGPMLALKKLLLAKVGFAALGGAGSGGGGAATATGGMAATAATTGSAAGGIAAAGGAGASAALPVGIGAATSKAIAGIAVTAILAGGAVEAKKVTTHEPAPPPPPAAVAPTPAPHPAATSTGGTSVKDIPDSLVEKAQVPPADTAPADQGASGATGAEGVGTTDSGGVSSPGDTGSDSAAGNPASKDQPPPASGSTTGTDTGGAAPPPAGTTAGTTGAPPPAPPTGQASGTTGP
jgi:RNA polymerase sigma factor (sigma-70 family)